MSAALPLPDRGSQPPDNVRALPARGFVQVGNDYFDALFGRVGPTAYLCLMYLIRNTLGYHRDTLRTSFKQVGDALGISRNTAMKALGELEALHIIASDACDRGRTQVHAYHLLPADAWTLPDTSPAPSCPSCPSSPSSSPPPSTATSPKSALAPTGDTTSPKSALVVSKIGLVEPQTSPKIGHLRNTENLHTASTDNSEANASGAAASARALAPSASSASFVPAASRNAHWDALVTVFGFAPTTKTERSNWGRVVKELKEAGAAAEDIPKRAANYILRYGRDRLTINALVTHWTPCETPPAQPRDHARRVQPALRGDAPDAPDRPPRRAVTTRSSAVAAPVARSIEPDDDDDDESRFPDPCERTARRLAAAVAAKRRQEGRTSPPPGPSLPRQ